MFEIRSVYLSFTYELKHYRHTCQFCIVIFSSGSLCATLSVSSTSSFIIVACEATPALAWELSSPSIEAACLLADLARPGASSRQSPFRQYRPLMLIGSSAPKRPRLLDR